MQKYTCKDRIFITLYQTSHKVMHWVDKQIQTAAKSSLRKKKKNMR